MNLSSVVEAINFSIPQDALEYYVIDDGVMGGRSSGRFDMHPDGYGHYYGKVSLENNGGFSSVRFRNFGLNKTGRISHFVLKLKGDGKTYQFRVKDDFRDRASYVYSFQTNGEEQVIEIPIEALIPSFRGRRLNMPAFDGGFVDEIGILIGNKKAESFDLKLYEVNLKIKD